MTPLLTALAPQIVACREPDGGCSLEYELARLDRCRAGGAGEAVVLYANRIVAAMTRHLVRDIHAPSPDHKTNVELLSSYGQLPGALRRWLLCLGRMTEGVARFQESLDPGDGELAVQILLRWLHWSFCERLGGPALDRITAHDAPLAALLPAELRQFIDSGGWTDAQLEHLASTGLLTPVIPAVVAEGLIAGGKLSQAQHLLGEARRRFPTDLRLRQLEGLLWSRRADAEKNPDCLRTARELLEGIRATPSPADQETTGILGGVCKRLWLARQDDVALLRRCHEEYLRGWEFSHQDDAYLGINVAATALWLGEVRLSVDTAGRVRGLLNERRERLGAMPGAPGLNFWDQLTLAEARRLLHDDAGADSLYQSAFAQNKDRAGDVRVAQEQDARNRHYLALSHQPER